MTSSSVLLILIYLRSSAFNVSVSFLDQNLHKYRILMRSSAVTLTIVQTELLRIHGFLCYTSTVSCITHPQFHVSHICAFMYHLSTVSCITHPVSCIIHPWFHVSHIYAFIYHLSTVSCIIHPQFHV